MRIINLSYNIPAPQFTDPESWLKRIGFSVGIMEAMAACAEVFSIYHINVKGQLQRNGVTHIFSSYKRWQVLIPFRLHCDVQRLKPDAVIVHGLFSPWQVILLRWKIGKKVAIIIQHHAEKPFDDVRRYLQRWADRYVKAYLFAAFPLGDDWVRRKQIGSRNKIREVMEASSHFSVMTREDARRQSKVADGIIYLWVGRLDGNKDPLTVVDAFSLFCRDYPDAKLYVIYQSVELEEQLRKKVNDYALSENVVLVGRIEHSQLLYWYNSADFILSSSHYEGSGIAVCEAMSCGCIPIVTKIPSFEMMTGRGAVGFLYPPGDSLALADALKNSIQLDRSEERRKTLAQFQSALSFESIARKIIDVLYE